MSGYKLAELQSVVNGQLHGPGECLIDHLAYDSRLEHPYSTTLFIAFKGEHHDGHAYIKQMYDKGVRNFLVQEIPAACPSDASILVTPDTLLALQQIAAAHRQKFDLPVIAITGSNGKTVVKEWLNHLLKSHRHVVRSPGSWNSQIGVPLSIWRMNKEHEIALFEAGISERGEMTRIAEMLQPTIGIFTNLGAAHAAGFEDSTQKAQEKASLFTHCEKVVFCLDHQIVFDALQSAGVKEEQHVCWSREKEAFLRVIGQEEHNGGTRIMYKHGGKAHEIFLPFSDDASLENALHCLTLCLLLGLSKDELKDKMRTLEALEMRLQVLEGSNGSIVLNDSYSNDPESLRVALEQLARLAGKRKKLAIISDMDERELDDESIYKEVASLLEHADLHTVHFVGERLASFAEHKNYHKHPTTQALIDSLEGQRFDHQAILVKGARSFGLERVVKRLQAKKHGSVLEVNLGAIKHNLGAYRVRIPKNTRIMVMLKAFGYGSGAPELGRLLEYEQVDYFGVAYASEGIQLRQEGINTPIMVMNTSGMDWAGFERFALEPTIHEIDQLRSFKHHFRENLKQVGVHLELDTGMHRLGFTPEQLPQLIQELDGIKVLSVFSHLAASDSSEHDDFTKEQLESHTQMCASLQSTLKSPFMTHVLNSSGISRFAEQAGDMVRLGIGLYGYDKAASGLIPAISLRSIISQIKPLKAGETVGYDRSFRAEKAMRMAVLPIGYADGLRRSLSNGAGVVYIKGSAAPIIGKVCMDMCMIDASDIDCGVGDSAVFFDAEHSLEEFASRMETIPYEVLTSFSQRIERRYLRDN